jgi:hypothetical protein
MLPMSQALRTGVSLTSAGTGSGRPLRPPINLRLRLILDWIDDVSRLSEILIIPTDTGHGHRNTTGAGSPP